MKPIPSGQSLEQEIAGIQAFEKRQSELVKLSSPHSLLEETAWTSASGVRGYRATYGFVGALRRLVYFLANGRRELVTIDVQLLAFETGTGWERYDKVVREGLELLR